MLNSKSVRDIIQSVQKGDKEMKTTYMTKGTCSYQIDVDLDGDIIKSVQFHGGCNGNLKGIAQLVTGMKATDAVAKLRGIRCGMKSTSCPDQLSKALEAALEK
jgi:uncharacterized protein (TIGR03905 family)